MNTLSVSKNNDIQIVPVQTSEQMKSFVMLPEKIYVGNQFWPGFDMEVEMATHCRETNYALSHYVTTQLYLAIQRGEVVGRISATINKAHNKFWDPDAGFFGHFECFNDHEVARALLSAAERWVKESGKKQIIGPYNYNYAGIPGLLINRHDDVPTVDLAFNPDYYPFLIENARYIKYKDLLEVMADKNKMVESVQKKITDVEQVKNANSGLILRTFDESNFKTEIMEIYDVYTDAFSGLWPFGYLNPEEWFEIMQVLAPLFPNDLFLVIEDTKIRKIVAFFFAEPNYNECILNRRLGKQESIERLKAFVIGIKDAYKGMGISKWLLYEFAERVAQSHYKEISFSWIGEDNKASIKVATSMGGHIDKIFRLYQKDL